MMCLQCRFLSCSVVCLLGAVCTVGFHCVAFFAAAATAAILPLLLRISRCFEPRSADLLMHLCLYSACTGTLCTLCILFVIPAPTGHEEDSTPQWAAEKWQTNQWQGWQPYKAGHRTSKILALGAGRG